MLDVFVWCLAATLKAVYHDWDNGHELAPNYDSYEEFEFEMIRMGRFSFLHPELEWETGLFGNHWRI